MRFTFTYLSKILLCCFLLMYGFAYAQTGWLSLGADDNNQPYVGAGVQGEIAVHPSTGDAYLSFRAAVGVSESEGYVRKFNNLTGLWENVGNSFSEGSVGSATLAFNSSGVLYVLYLDTSNGSKVRLKKLNSATNLWETVGNGPLFTGQVSNLTLAMGPDDVVYVCYSDILLNSKATVKKFDGTNWITVGVEGFTASSANYNSLAVAADNTLYVGFVSVYSTQYKCTVMKFAGTSWEILGTAGFSDGGASSTNVKVNPVTNVPYIAYSDFLNGYKAKVKKFNGTSWENVGLPGFSQGLADNISFAFTSEGTPYVGYSDSILGGKAAMMKFNGTAWENVGLPGFSIGDISFTDVALAGNTPYMSFSDYPNANKATLMKYDGSNWISLGGTMGFSKQATFTQGISPSKACDFIITEDGSPYMGYIENSKSDFVTVKKYNFTTSEWDSVGASGFSITNATHLNMDFYQNLPYVAYTQKTSPYKATVMRYNGSAWTLVGQQSFTPGGAHQVDISISPNGTPYVVYKDVANANKATVMMFNGVSWVTVGNPGFSVGQVYEPNIIITAGGIPYVAFVDTVGPIVTSSVVMKFNGFSWEAVGDAFDSLQAYFINLEEGPDGIVYVAYSNSVNSKATVKKFNGAVWENIGDYGFSIGLVEDVTMSIKPDGQLFVGFSDSTNYFKATIMRYNGLEWVSVGDPGISASHSRYLDMAITPDGQYSIIAYSSPCTYAKMYDVTCYTTAPVAADQAFCNSALVSDLIAEGDNLRWYTTEEFGVALGSDVPLVSGTYYVSQMQNDCEGPRTAIEVVVNVVSQPLIENQSFCNVATVADLYALGENLKWYTDEEGGEMLLMDLELESGTYYVSQTQDECESEKSAVQVVITTVSIPEVSAQLLCNGAVVSDFIGEGENLKWYVSETGGESLANDVPVTEGTYYVSQTVNECESSRVAVDVIVNITLPPVVDNQEFCDGATISDLTAQGENLKWYESINAIVPLAEDVLLASGVYFVSQEQNGCESVKEAVDVFINVTPLPEGESSQVLTVADQNDATVEDLIVNGEMVQWYDAENTPIALNAVLENGLTYFATQTIDGCESEKLAVTVEVLLGRTGFDKMNFAYYPNPVIDKLSIVSDDIITQVDVYTLYGQKVISEVWDANEGKIEVSGLANGAYFLKVYGENGMKSFKIIKGNF